MVEQSSGPSAITGHITVDGKQVQQFGIPATGRVSVVPDKFAHSVFWLDLVPCSCRKAL